MTTLWNPRKVLNQPPSYGQITSVKATPTSCPVAESLALAALKHKQNDRHKNGSRATVFDKSVKVRT